MQVLATPATDSFEIKVEEVSCLRNYASKFPSKFDSRLVEIGLAISLIESAPEHYSLVSIRSRDSIDFGRDFGFLSHERIDSDRADFLEFLAQPYNSASTVFIVSNTCEVQPHNSLNKFREQIEPLYPVEPMDALDYTKFRGGLDLVSQGKDGRFHTTGSIANTEYDYSDESSGTVLGGISISPGLDIHIKRTTIHFKLSDLGLDLINGFFELIESFSRGQDIEFDELILESDNPVLVRVLAQTLKQKVKAAVYTPQFFLGYSPSGSLLSLLQIACKDKAESKNKRGRIWLHIQSMGRIEIVYIK